MPSKPLTPQEAHATQIESLPDVVIDSVNELLAKKSVSHGRIVIMQDEVIKAIMSKGEFTRAQIFANHWLDFEAAYRAAGWYVDDKPAYNESYEPSFTFTPNPK